MKSKSKDLKKTVPDKNASLERVINQNEKIKETVKQAANELIYLHHCNYTFP